MPELHGTPTLALAEVVREQLVREFTAHSRPQVNVDLDTVGDGYRIRYRIFGDLQGEAHLDRLTLDVMRTDQGGVTGLIHHVVRSIVNDVRRAPAYMPEVGAMVDATVERSRLLQQHAQDLVQQINQQAGQWRQQINERTADFFRQIAAQQDSERPPVSGTQSELGDQAGANGVAPSRGEVGATQEGPSALDLILGDDE